jgi:steroid 5-alpha reductase family enzyme
MGYHWAAFGAAFGWIAVAVVVLLSVFFLIGVRLGRHNVVDTAWGLGFATVAVVGFALSSGDGDWLRRTLLLVCPLVWGVRLAWHIGRRSRGKGEDPRYDELLGKATGNRDLYAARVVYAAQGLLILFISLPISVGQFAGGPVSVLGWMGATVWAIGLFFESVGDRQMARFKADPANRGRLIDVGLWRYTRHPNYFGDACVWVGLYLIAAERWPGALTVLSPAVMVYLLAFGSGKRVLERSMMKRPGYREYAERTSGFIPWPPRSSR